MDGPGVLEPAGSAWMALGSRYRYLASDTLPHGRKPHAARPGRRVLFTLMIFHLNDEESLSGAQKPAGKRWLRSAGAALESRRGRLR